MFELHKPFISVQHGVAPSEISCRPFIPLTCIIEQVSIIKPMCLLILMHTRLTPTYCWQDPLARRQSLWSAARSRVGCDVMWIESVTHSFCPNCLLHSPAFQGWICHNSLMRQSYFKASPAAELQLSNAENTQGFSLHHNPTARQLLKMLHSAILAN